MEPSVSGHPSGKKYPSDLKIYVNLFRPSASNLSDHFPKVVKELVNVPWEIRRLLDYTPTNFSSMNI